MNTVTMNQLFGSSGTYSPSSSNVGKESTGSTLDMTSFLQLLAAQFQNQDPTNPTDNTEYISELAQFSSLQAMNTLTQYADEQYAASLVGKTVEVAQRDTNGQLVKKTGVVTSANFASSSGSTIFLDNDNNTSYSIGNVMQVLASNSQTTTPTDPDSGSGSDSGSGDGTGSGDSTGDGTSTGGTEGT